MSSILKALKKLEQEKTLHEEAAGINVSREILKQNRSNRNIITWFWLLGGTAAVVIVILTVLLLQKSTIKEAAKSGEQPIARQLALPALPVQNLSVSPETIEKVKGPNPVSPLSANQPNLTPSQQIPPQTPEKSITKESFHLPNTPVPVGDPPNKDPAVNVVKSQPAPSSEPKLTLSGIAWNKDSADRLAIINGQPTTTGATINGARVEEILQDRVKLSRDGRIFELLIGRDARTD